MYAFNYSLIFHNMTFEQLFSRRLYEQLAERSRHLILNGALNPGDKRPAEQMLGQDYGVSRTVVREAANILRRDEQVEVKAGIVVGVVDATDQAFVQWRHLMMSPNLTDNEVDAAEILELKPFATQVRPALETRNDEQYRTIRI